MIQVLRLSKMYEIAKTVGISEEMGQYILKETLNMRKIFTQLVPQLLHADTFKRNRSDLMRNVLCTRHSVFENKFRPKFTK